jgi:hypothetical protein
MRSGYARDERLDESVNAASMESFRGDTVLLPVQYNQRFFF